MRRTIGLLAALTLTLGAACQETAEAPEEAQPTQEPEPTRTPDATPDATPDGASQASEKVLRVSVTDDTSAWEEGTSGVPDMEVWIRGTGSWFPDTSFGSDVLEEAGPFPVGEETEFFVYPTGREEPELAVRTLVTEEVIAASVRDMIRITVEDDQVTVTGTPIPDFEATFDY